MNMLILKSTFESVPVELEEAAVIDGAGQFSMLGAFICRFPKQLWLLLLCFMR